MSEPKFASYINSLETLFRSGDGKADEKPAEAANIRLIQTLITAIGRNDLAAVADLLTDDVRLEIDGGNNLFPIRTAQGCGPMLEAIKQNFGAVQNQQSNIQAVVAQGDTVIVLMGEAGEVVATGAPYRLKGMQRFLMREGKVALVEELILTV